MNDNEKIPGLGLTLAELQRARSFRAKPFTGAKYIDDDCSHEAEPTTGVKPNIVYNITVNNVTNHFEKEGYVMIEGTRMNELR